MCVRRRAVRDGDVGDADRAGGWSILATMGSRQGRVLVVAVVVLVASGGCSGGDGEGGAPDVGSEPTTTTVAPPERPAVEDLEAAGVGGERIETDRLFRQFVVLDDVLLALVAGAPRATSLPGGPAAPGGRSVERSTDLGETWEPVELPGAPDGPQVVPPVVMVAGDRAVV